MRNKYLQECETIYDYCRYNAEAHHILAEHNEKLAFWFQVVPAVIAAFAVLQANGVPFPDWASPLWAWLAAVSSIITAVSTILNPLKGYFDHLNAAKSFVVLKHDARALRDTFHSDKSDEALKLAVENLHERYNYLVKSVPPTTKKAYEKARENLNKQKKETE